MPKEVVRNTYDRILVSQESKTVLLVSADAKGDAFNGSFLSPEEARAVAASLLEAADAAENDHRQDIVVGSTYMLFGGGHALIASKTENGYEGEIRATDGSLSCGSWNLDGAPSKGGRKNAIMIIDLNPPLFG